MFGLGIVAVLALYLSLIWFVAKRLRRLWARIALVILASIGPIADSVVGTTSFANVCRKEAGVFVHRQIKGADGYLAIGVSLDRSAVSTGQFKFIESESVVGFKRLELDSKGQFDERIVGSAISKYEVASIGGRQKVSLNITKLQVVTRDRSTKEVLGQAIQFEYSGGWLERVAFPTGPAARCPEGDQVGDLIRRTFYNTRAEK